jgi:hypothetical protein
VFREGSSAQGGAEFSVIDVRTMAARAALFIGGLSISRLPGRERRRNLGILGIDGQGWLHDQHRRRDNQPSAGIDPIFHPEIFGSGAIPAMRDSNSIFGSHRLLSLQSWVISSLKV